MKWCSALVICLMGGFLAGCEKEQCQNRDTRNLDAELVNTINSIGVENAILTQHTLYPYHFVADSEKLNDLGGRDLGVLAKHFVAHPGVLNIRRGETGAELYEARVAYVVNKLKEAGVETNRMSLSDGMPGGAGITSDRVVTILQKESEPLTTGTKATTTEMISR